MAVTSDLYIQFNSERTKACWTAHLIKHNSLKVQSGCSGCFCHSGLDLPEGAIGGAVVSGESLELQRVKGVLSTSHVFHSVFSPAAFTERDTVNGTWWRKRRKQNKVSAVKQTW